MSQPESTRCDALCHTPDGTPLHLEGVQARGRIVGRLLDMTLEQRFRNPEEVNVEVVYTFPLPWHAVLLGLEVTLNGETLTGLVKPKATARTDYDDAVAEGDSAVLVTVNRDGTHTLELGNLLPGETCTVRLHYVQVLQPHQDSLRLLLPATLAPRYGDPVRDGGYEPHAVPETDPAVAYPFDIRLDIEGDLTRAAIGSPSHPVTLRTLPAIPTAGAGEGVIVQVALGRQAWLDRDFVLVFDGLGQTSLGLAAWDRLDEGLGVVMASFTPALPTRMSLPVAMKVLVDCSGSMEGDSIEAARRALRRILDGLHSSDRFSLSRFGSSVEHRSRGLWKATPASLASGRRWVEALEADLGGTEMRDAILSTLQLGDARGDILLITDGDIHAIDDVVEAARRSRQRFFIVGIGASVSEGLLRQLADATGGSCEFVAPGEAVEPAVVRLYHRMRSPRVLHARIEWPAGCTVHAASDLPKGLYAGDDVTVFARLRAPAAQALGGPVRLYGRTEGVEGEVLLAELTPRFIADEANTLARLAAHQRHRQLMQTGRDAPAVLRQQLPALAEKYQLVTEHTSLVLVKQRADGERPDEMPALRTVKGMLAAGWGGEGSVPFSVADPSMAFSVARAPSASRMRFGKNPPATRAMRSTPNRAQKRRDVLDRLMDDAPGHTPDGGDTGNHAFVRLPEHKPAFWTASAERESGIRWAALDGLTPAGFLEWLRLNPQAPLATYEDLRNAHLPEAVVEWLEFTVGALASEADAVAAFVQVMAGQNFTFVQTVAAVLGRLARPGRPAPPEVAEAVQTALSTLTATEWPAAVLDPAQHEENG